LLGRYRGKPSLTATTEGCRACGGFVEFIFRKTYSSVKTMSLQVWK